MTTTAAVWVDRSGSPNTARVTLPPHPGNLSSLDAHGVVAWEDTEHPGTYVIWNTRRARYLANVLARAMGGCWYIVRQSNHDAQWCTTPCMEAKPETADDCTCRRCGGTFHGTGPQGTEVTDHDPRLVLVAGPTTTEIRRWIS